MKLVNVTEAIRGYKGMEMTKKLKEIIEENRLKNRVHETKEE